MTSATPPSPTLRPLARFAAEAAWEDAPPLVRERTREILLDAVGVLLAGSATEVRPIARSTLDLLGGGGTSRVLGTPWKADALTSALVHGLFLMALDFEPVGPEGHVVAAAVPAALALLDGRERSGRELLIALAVGLEVGGRIGRGMRRVPARERAGLLVRGNPHTVFGAAATAARLLRLREAEMEHAMAIAAYQAMPATLRRTMQNPPIPLVKYDHLPAAAEMGVQAAVLAAAGATGDLAVLDGPDGFWRFTGHVSFDAADVLADLGDDWMIPATRHKLYPGSLYAGSAVQAAVDLVRENGLDPSRIREVGVHLPHPTPAQASRRPITRGDACLSVPIGVACALLDVRPYAARCRAEVLAQPRVHELVGRTTVHELPGPRADGAAWEGYAPALVRVVTDEGRTLEKESSSLPPVSGEELTRRFRENAATALGDMRATELLRTLGGLGEAADARALFDAGCADAQEG